MADEAIYPPEDAIEVVRRRAASIALMKLNKHGGITNVHQIGMIFEAAGLSLSVSIYYDLIADLACGPFGRRHALPGPRRPRP